MSLLTLVHYFLQGVFRITLPELDLTFRQTRQQNAPPHILASVLLVLCAQRQTVTPLTAMLAFVVVQCAQKQRVSFAPRLSVGVQPCKRVPIMAA